MVGPARALGEREDRRRRTSATVSSVGCVAHVKKCEVARGFPLLQAWQEWSKIIPISKYDILFFNRAIFCIVTCAYHKVSSTNLLMLKNLKSDINPQS